MSVFLRYGMIATTLLASTIVGSLNSYAQDRVSTDKLVPRNTVFYISVPSVENLKTRFGESSYGKLKDDENLKEFVENLKEGIAKASEKFETDTGVKLDALLGLPSGEAAFALVRPPREKIAFELIMSYGDNSALVESLLEKADAALTEKGAKRSTEEFEGTNVTVYTTEQKTVDPFGDEQIKENKIAVFTKDNRLVVSSSVTAVEQTLVRWDGQHENTLASNEVYSYIMDRCKIEGSQPVLNYFIDPVNFVTAASMSADEPDIRLTMLLGMLPTLGLNNLKGAGGSTHIATEEYDSINNLVIYVDQPTSGLLDVARFPAIEQSPPKWVAEDTTSYIAANWDVSTAFDAIRFLVDSFRGQGNFDQTIDRLANAEGGPNIHIKKDIIDNISGRLHVITKSEIGEAGATQLPLAIEKALVALELKNVDAMSGTLSQAAQTPGFPGKSRDYRGTNIYEVPLPTPPEASVQQSLAIAIVHDHLMFSNDVERLEQAIRGDGKPLSESAEFKQIATKMPAKTSIIGFQKQNTQIKSLYDLLRKAPQLSEQVGVDFSKLPPFETIEKYLKPQGTFFAPDQKGVFIGNYTLR